MKKRIFVVVFFLFGLLFVGAVWHFWFSAPGEQLNPVKQQAVTITEDTAMVLVGAKLRQEGYIRSETAFNLAFGWSSRLEKLPAGGYEISKQMNVFEVVKILSQGPTLKWATFVPGLRKEQMAEILTFIFSWKSSDVDSFLNAYKKVTNGLPEGNYYPDTYLIPVNETGEQVGIRMINRFNEKFAPLSQKLLEANIKNDTAVKIASLIQRESAGPVDAPLIAGIIWNRLEKGMPLQLDATIQYSKGLTDGKWWSPVYPKDLKIDSPYNDYLHKGLPPTAISNPAIWAIEAVLNSEETDCVYYLHDSLHNIHCSPTYEGHLKNIQEFLR